MNQSIKLLLKSIYLPQNSLYWREIVNDRNCDGGPTVPIPGQLWFKKFHNSLFIEMQLLPFIVCAIYNRNRNGCRWQPPSTHPPFAICWLCLASSLEQKNPPSKTSTGISYININIVYSLLASSPLLAAPN